MSDEKKLSKARQALIDRVLSRLDAGAMPWDNGMRGMAAPRNAISGKHYRGMNLLNLLLSGKQDPRWLTFNQAKDNGYTVKKGANGVPIELYKIIDKRTGKDADLDAIREEIKDMTFEERQAFKKENLQSFARSYYVFNASDVAGIEPYVPKDFTPTDISKRNERIEQIIANSEAPIYYDGNGRNYYDRSVDEIHLTDRKTFTSDEFFYNTALHEMAHSTGPRLNRNMGDGFGSKSYAREELVAEISSVLTAAELGLDHSDRVIENSAEYVRSWAELIRDDPQTLIDATFDASKATDYICDMERNRVQTQEKTQKESVQSKSPLYNRYAALQDKYSDAVIFMRIGDFYEIMGEKARTVAEEAGLTLTGRDVGLPERVPMCGVPYHAIEQYVEKIRGKHAVVLVDSENEERYMPSHGAAQKTPLERLDEERTQKENLQSNVREWYSRQYPTDDLASELESKTTFGDVRDAIRSGKDVYDILGVEDGVVRERVFRKLAEVIDVPYKAVYDAWINGTESEQTRSERQRQAAMQDFPKDFADEGLLDETGGAAQRTQPPKGQQHRKPLMVNFYAGPSSGKTTAALELTAALKKAGYNVEYVAEYAKELVLENRSAELADQRKVTDEQYRRFDRIRNSADIIVTDSPILLGLVYGDGKIDDAYKKQIRRYYDSFDNFNMFVERPSGAAFQTEGRIHDEKQSIELDGKIKSMLETQGVFYGNYKRDDIAKTVERISTTYNRLYGDGGAKKESKAAPPYKLKTNLDNIPDAMKSLPNWVAFRTEASDGKVKKILLSPNKGASDVQYLKWAKSDDPTTWASFDKAAAFARKYKLDGLAFAMSGSGMTCIDLDHHLDEHGKPSELAQKYLNAAQGTYIERSVSGRGLHIFYAGSRPADRQNRNIQLDLETYDSGRFISMTGNLYGDTSKEISPPSAELKNLLASNLAKVPQYSTPSVPLGMDDNALIEKIRGSKVGRDFEALWSGADICGDRSVSDFKLCNMLAFFSGGDAAQVERCFRSSGLYRQEKGEQYVKRTAEKACATLLRRYEPRPAKLRGKPTGSGSGGNTGR